MCLITLLITSRFVLNDLVYKCQFTLRKKTYSKRIVTLNNFLKYVIKKIYIILA